MPAGAGLLVKRISRAFDAVVRPPTGVTVLIYHRVGGDSASKVDLDASLFGDQLAILRDTCRVLTLDAAVTELVAPSPSGPATSGPSTSGPGVVLTFDDGTSDFCDVAVPLLVQYGLPATLYAATQYIDEGSEFPWGAPPTSWAALRDAVSTGLVTVGSHTHSHWLLDRLDASTVEADLDRSIELIGEHLGVEAAHFAYPKALPGSAAAEVAVRRRFRSAALAASRVNRPGRTDAHRLWRTPVQRGDGTEFFAAKARGGLRLEGELRAAAARLRYQGQSR